MKIVYAKYGRSPIEDIDEIEATLEQHEKKYPWLKGESVLYLGEIKNMPGHGVYSRKTGESFYGYHIDDFIDSDAEGLLYLDDHVVSKTDLQNNKKYPCLKLEKLKQLEDIDFISKDLLKTFDDYKEWDECEELDEEDKLVEE